MIRGANIYLRALEPPDVELLYQWENDTSIWRISNTSAPFSKDVLQRYISDSRSDIYASKQLRLVICKKDGTAIGTVDLFDFDPNHRRAGIGILIAEKKERRNGYASEALNLLADYCFSTLNLHQLYCNISSDNKPSIGLFKKNKFREAGKKKQWIRDGSKFLDEYLLQRIGK